MSDETYHIKAGEQLCQLYNNEWADAFKELTKTKTEKEAIEMLLEVMMVRDETIYFRPPDKSVIWKIIFFISHPKHMLWVLKRTVSMMFKIVGKKIIKSLRK